MFWVGYFSCLTYFGRKFSKISKWGEIFSKAFLIVLTVLILFEYQ